MPARPPLLLLLPLLLSPLLPPLPPAPGGATSRMTKTAPSPTVPLSWPEELTTRSKLTFPCVPARRKRTTPPRAPLRRRRHTLALRRSTAAVTYGLPPAYGTPL